MYKKPISIIVSLFITVCSSTIYADTVNKQGVKGESMEEVISVPGHSVRYFGLMIKTAKGVAGRIVLNDTEIERFDTSSSQISSNQPQCFLRVGDNDLTVDLVQVDKDSAKLTASSLVKLDLHAMNEPDFPNDSNLFFSLNWTPEKSATKTYRFVLAENQKPTRTAICD